MHSFIIAMNAILIVRLIDGKDMHMYVYLHCPHQYKGYENKKDYFFANLRIFS